MKAALILGSIGAAAILSGASNKGGTKGSKSMTPRSNEQDADTFEIDTLSELHIPFPGKFCRPSVSCLVDDGTPYSLAATAISNLTKSMMESGVIGERRRASISSNRRFISDLAQLVHSSPFNDCMYGQKNSCCNAMENCGRHGRSVAIEPKHVDVEYMIKNEIPLIRTIDDRGKLLPDTPSWRDHRCPRHMPVVWIPVICPESLMSGTVTTYGYEYEDGSSTIVPPPEIMALLT